MQLSDASLQVSKSTITPLKLYRGLDTSTTLDAEMGFLFKLLEEGALRGKSMHNQEITHLFLRGSPWCTGQIDGLEKFKKMPLSN